MYYTTNIYKLTKEKSGNCAYLVMHIEILDAFGDGKCDRLGARTAICLFVCFCFFKDICS